MPPVAVDNAGPMLNGLTEHKVDTMNPHDCVRFDKSLTPKRYELKGTDPSSKIFFQQVNIIDSTGRLPFTGDVYIEGERIKAVGDVPGKERLLNDSSVRVIEGRGRTLMSGLGDAHTHFSWNEGDLGALGELGVEEHTLQTARAAQIYLDSGYTMCFGAASAKERLDCVIRDAINDGKLPGPRYLANGKEMAVPDGELVPGITAFAKGPLEMRETIRHHIKIGVDQIKLSMSGEQITEIRDAQDCYFTDEETAACVDEAHRHGIRLCAHARARDSFKQCITHGVDVIYHASWIDEEGMDMLYANKDKHRVAPGINWLIATIYEASAFGYSFEKAEQVGYKKELDAAIKGLKEMHRRGITVLPEGDYGFSWTPHGTYARDLQHFVELLDFTPMESIVAATAGVAKLFMREDELGKILPGYYADCILVDGNPLDDISTLQNHEKLNIIMINGRIHKASYKEFLRNKAVEFADRPQPKSLTNYVAYALDDGTGRTRIGHLDVEGGQIIPLSFESGTPIENLYQVIEVGSEGIIAGAEPIPLTESVDILPPIAGRDILAVGKNYAEHAKEFNASGYDASDKIDMPSHPVIFTKRATSIIANEEEILLHEDFTSTLDYEGEIGVIIGKGGFQISEAEANHHIWGYTIVNDVTAREEQRDHKQFYIGKSADTFCPMGPIAVPATALPQVLQEMLLPQAHQLERFGLKPPQFLKAGDLVEVSVTGLGTLRNRVSKIGTENSTKQRLERLSCIPTNNLSLTLGGVGLIVLGNTKPLDVKVLGSGPRLLVFVYGLGGSKNFYTPLLPYLGLDKPDHKEYTTLLYDFEGHGLSPTKATSTITIRSLADDLHSLLKNESLGLPLQNHVTIVAHSMGCLVASLFASQHPDLAHRLILLGPPTLPLPQSASEATIKRAAVVRADGMRNVATAVSTAGTSKKTQSDRPLTITAVQMSLLATDPEGYAKGCTALASARDLKVGFNSLSSEVLIMAGEEDKVSPRSWAKSFAGRIPKSKLTTFDDVGHWHVYEDVTGVAKAMKAFLK